MIRLLILAGTPGLYGNNNSYNGGGWIVSLERELLAKHRNELTVGLAWPADCRIKDEVGGVKYYGIPKIHRTFWKYESKEKKYCEDIKQVISDFQPDIILCFGTENGLALATSLTEIPVIVHLQGILNAYFPTWLPENLSWKEYLGRDVHRHIEYDSLKKFMQREIVAMEHCKYFFGRTEWDHNISQLISPNSEYFYCSEMLRPEIYSSKKLWEPHENKQAKIVSVISGAPYKGGDLILRAAKALKETGNSDFVWDVYGVDSQRMRFWEKLTNICSAEVNVHANGVINASQLVDAVTSADVCVHPSYIENSPNTVCEMQVLGCPVIATNVGGTSSLIKDGETGFLVPANDPLTLTSKILYTIRDKKKAYAIGRNARTCALQRHNPSRIVSDLINSIHFIVDNK